MSKDESFMNKIVVIRCPKCGYEYLPAEVFYEDKLVGNPTNIIRDDNGKIIYFDNDTMSFKEEFECYNCGCTFNINGKLDIVTKISDNDFSDDYSVCLSDDNDNHIEDSKDLW